MKEKAPTTSNIKRLIAVLLPYFNMEIKEDLTCAPNYITSRCNWPFDSEIDNLTVIKSDETEWTFAGSWDTKLIIYGIKIALNSCEKNATESMIFEEKFQVNFRESLIVKDIYFRKPFVTDPKDKYDLTVKFESAQKRLYIENWLILLDEHFNPAIHKLFVA